MSQIKLCIGHPYRILLQGFATALALEDDITVVGQSSNVADFKNKQEQYQPDVLLLASDFASSLALLHLTPEQLRKTVIIAERYEAPFYGMGTGGFIYSSIAPTRLRDCVRTVAKGGFYLDQPTPSEDDSASEERERCGQRVRKRLNKRQLIIMILIADGYKNKEIATAFDTSVQMIKNALRHIFNKIGVGDRLELALFFVHHKDALAGPASEACAEFIRDGKLRLASTPSPICKNQREPTIAATFNALTPKARAVLYLFCSGTQLTNQQIGERLGTTASVVRNQLENAPAKFGFKTTGELRCLFSTCPRLRKTARAEFAKIETKAAAMGKKPWEVLPDKRGRQLPPPATPSEQPAPFTERPDSLGLTA